MIDFLRIFFMKNKKSNKFLLVLFSVVFLFMNISAINAEKEGKKKETAKTEIKAKTTEDNPFFLEFKTPFKVPPFDLIKEEHYLPAFKKGMEVEKKEIDAIVNNPEPATFANTIETMDDTGELLSTVARVFFSLRSADTNEKMQKIAREVIPLLTEHNNDISLNEKLFERVKAVYKQIDNLDLNTSQKKLLDDTYQGFVRSGADLSKEDKEKLRAVNKELSMLQLKFGENVLADTNDFKLILDKKEDLEGLPKAVIDGAAIAAKNAGYEGKWLFTLHKPSWIPFLQYSPKRHLREKLYKGYINVGDNDNKFDNKKIVAQVAALRVKRAKLMGYKTHADFRLERNMAKNSQNVYNLLNQLWVPALKMAKKEAADQQALIDREGGKFKLSSWDWWYYTEKLRKEKYDLDEEKLRPYFQLENVKKGVFYVANQLYGLKFVKRDDIPVYHPEVEVYEVQEGDGSHVGVLYMDFFPRSSKRGGAWCGSLRNVSIKDGKKTHPLVYIVMNGSKPAGDIPALFSLDEVHTLFHEFGHALHNLLSNCQYKSQSGTSVARDFVELPSQIMEHWVMEPEVLKVYARHYKTGEVIPEEIVDKLEKSTYFNQGFATVEYLAACFLDMNWHTLTDVNEVATDTFEKECFQKIGLIPEIISRYRSTYFRHIMGGYDSGYYAYIWANVLDCDAFEAFKETSLFDQKTAQAFRKNILEKGGSEDPMVLYKRFRGREPRIEPLLKERGLTN